MMSSLVFAIVLFSATPQSNPSPSPTPLPQVQGVTVSKAVQDSSAALRVSWSAVSGSGITYTVCYSVHPNGGTTPDPPDNANCDTRGITGTSTTLNSLSPGALHFIWVAAVSSGRRGPFSSKRGVGTYQVPSAVGPLSITQVAMSGQLALTVSWSKPQSELTITRYDVEYKVSNAGSWTTKTVTGANTLSTTLTNLEGGRSYDIRLRAVSPVGGGGYSPVQTQKAGNVPSLVGRPTVTQTAVSGRPALAVSWRAPQSDLAITGYDVQYRRSDSNNWDPNDVMRSTLLAVTLTSLTAGRSYDVRVRAVSAVGAGAYGPHQTQRLSTVPSAVGTPSVTRVVVSGRPALRVSWTKPSSELAITRYDVQYRQSGTIAWSTVVVSGSNTVTTTLTTLVASRSYDVQVRAVSAAGTGAFSRTQSPVVGRGNLCCSVTGTGQKFNHTNLNTLLATLE